MGIFKLIEEAGEMWVARAGEMWVAEVGGTELMEKGSFVLWVKRMRDLLEKERAKILVQKKDLIERNLNERDLVEKDWGEMRK
ncbi:hypothetical protein U1Q18_038174 [Sarracenia purpurea var. burkii]